MMAQQTRIAVAVRYYLRFLERFPTVGSLAAASEQEVLRLWAGLGYYGRARMLHSAARAVEEGYGGHLPTRPEELRSLPGVGEYTAAAVGSIAFGLPLAAVDGNVQRVLARLKAVPGDPRRGKARKRVRETAEALLDHSRPGDFNQALMELGALVCLPRNPRCRSGGGCPLLSWCRAQRLGRIETIPPPAKRRPSREIHWVALAILRPPGEDGIWMEAIPADGWNAGLQDLPGGPVDGPDQAGATAAELARERGLTGPPEPVGGYSHSITHHRFRVRLFRLVGQPVAPGDPRGSWLPLPPPEDAGLCARATRGIELIRRRRLL